MKVLFGLLALSISSLAQETLPPYQAWYPLAQNSPGGNDDIGTLPRAGAQPDPGRTTQGTVNVQPCDNATNGGSSVVNACTSEGDIAMKSNGDVNLDPKTDATVLLGHSSDTVKVQSDSGVGVWAPAGSTVIIDGTGTTVEVRNYSDPSATSTNNVDVRLNGTNYTVPPKTTVRFTTPRTPPV
jgi:hypothetical protein